jgi:hypothetical protein
VDPGAGLDRCGKSRTTGIRSPDLPARSESLYRLSYPGSNDTNYRRRIYVWNYVDDVDSGKGKVHLVAGREGPEGE